MDIEKKTDLISFINDESKIYEDPNLNKIFKCFCKCFCKTLKDISVKFKGIETLDIKEALIMGTNMIYHIYWLLIGYANNLKLTIFLTERAILLYTEFIIMSRDPKLNKDIYFTPNIYDAVAFAYKKTIGPIKLSSFSNNNLNKITCIKNASSIIKYILQECYIKINNNKNLNIDIDNINDNLYYILLNIFVKSNDESLFVYVFDKTILIFTEFSDNLILTIVFWKVFFDVLSDFLSRGKNIKNLISIMEQSYFEFTKRILEGKYIKENFNLKMVKKLKLYNDLKLFVSFQFRKK